MTLLRLLPLLASSAADGGDPISRGRLLLAYMNCAQPGPTPTCAYHPYFNTVSPLNTTCDPNTQLQVSAGKADGIHSTSGYDPSRELVYFFQGTEKTIYTVDAKNHAVLPPVPLDTASALGSYGRGCTFLGITAAYWDSASNTLLGIMDIHDPKWALSSGLVQIDPASGAMLALDAALDADRRVSVPTEGGLIAGDGNGTLVVPRVDLLVHPHSFSAVNTSTGVMQIVDMDLPLTMIGLEYGDGAFWAVGTLLPNNRPSREAVTVRPLVDFPPRT